MLLAGDSSRRFQLLAASDIRAVAGLTHRNRFHTQLALNYDFIVEDIRDHEFIKKLKRAVRIHCGKSSVDVVVGGPPCQGFSLFGSRNEEDPRNDLFLPYLRCIESLTPKYFVMENVPGFAMMYGGRVVQRMHDEVSRMRPIRYIVNGPIKVNASEFGVPQLRERILFIGSREDVPPLKTVVRTHRGSPITVRQAIGDLAFLRPWQKNGHYHPDHPARTDYQRNSRTGRLFKRFEKSRHDMSLKNHEAAKHSPEVIARFAMIEKGKGLDSIPKELWAKHLKTSKKWCIKLDPDKPSFTVVTLPDDFVHYEHPRILTVRELARLQSFDDTFEFLGPRATGGGGKGNKKRSQELPQYTQVGNAVPPLLAKGIGETLLHALAKTATTKRAPVLVPA